MHFGLYAFDLYEKIYDEAWELEDQIGTSRTGFFLSSFKKWREEILLQAAHPTVFADLGYGVLDTAMVETAAYCLEAMGQGAHHE